MANRVQPFTDIETLSGNISAATYFDNNIGPAFGALNDSSLGYCNGIATDTGSANNYVLASAIGTASAYNPGMLVAFIPANTNTTASSLTIDGLAAQSIVDSSGNTLGVYPGAIRQGQLTVCIYIGGAFRLINPANRGMLFANPNITSGSITQDCSGYTQVQLSLDTTLGGANQTYTVLLENVTYGARIDVLWVPRGANQTLKFSNSCTTQNGSLIGNITSWDYGDGTINLITGGYSSVTQYATFVGALGEAIQAGPSEIRFLAGFK